MSASNCAAANLHFQLDNILNYIRPHLQFINCHMVTYITENNWSRFIPMEIQQEIHCPADAAKAVEIFWNHTATSHVDGDYNDFPNFRKFLNNSKRFRLENLPQILLTLAEMNEKLQSPEGIDPPLTIKEFMSEKKNHEVEITANLVSRLCGAGKNISIIDAGDGKGYLSSRLALEYHHKVLGIDANADNTEGAIKRVTKLEKAWTGLTKRAENNRNGIETVKQSRRQRRNLNQEPALAARSIVHENYKTATCFITPDTDFLKLFSAYFPLDNSHGFCLSGLHTCGNLASTCLRIFVANSSLKSLCNVGCCYHLLQEKFREDDFFDNRKNHLTNPADFGFPMSAYLMEQQVSMGRNARMLGCQSIHRTVSTKELPNRSLFYRALLEVLVVDRMADMANCVQVGRIKKFNSFREYVAICTKKQPDDQLSRILLDISDSDLRQLEERFEFESHRLNLFYLIRMTFAPIIETIILLDRLLYLVEQQKSSCYLVQLFDPIVSPRCYGIVSLKTN